MPETITSILGRTNALDASFKIEMADMLFKYRPGSRPFLTILTKLSQGKGIAYKTEWQNQNPIPTSVQYTGTTESSQGATINIANYLYLRPGDILFYPRYRERIRVTVANSPTVSVSRNIGGSAPSSLLQSGDMLIIAAPVVEEGADLSASPRHINPTSDYNWQQEMENYSKTTKIAAKSMTYTGEDERQRNIENMMDFHRKDGEMTLCFGDRFSTSGTTLNIRGMGGLDYYIQSNRWYLNSIADFSRLAFEDRTREVIEMSPEAMNRYFFCSPFLKSRMTGWGYEFFAPSELNSKTFGFEISTYHSGAGGDIQVVSCPSFAGDAYLEHFGFLVDLAYIKWITFEPTELKLNTQEDYRNYHLDKVRTVASVRVANEARHMVVQLI